MNHQDAWLYMGTQEEMTYFECGDGFPVEVVRSHKLLLSLEVVDANS
mgnify:CR=1 FL=1